jgi:hypothetical protein
MPIDLGLHSGMNPKPVPRRFQMLWLIETHPNTSHPIKSLPFWEFPWFLGLNKPSDLASNVGTPKIAVSGLIFSVRSKTACSPAVRAGV